MLEQQINTLGWNMRGLNDQDRKDTVHETIAATSCHIVCLQETKLESVSAFDASYIGGYWLRGFAERPATGTRGGWSSVTSTKSGGLGTKTNQTLIIAVSTVSRSPFNLVSFMKSTCKIVVSLGAMKEKTPPIVSSMPSIAIPIGMCALTPMSLMRGE
jgi:hypothetical protein